MHSRHHAPTLFVAILLCLGPPDRVAAQDGTAWSTPDSVTTWSGADWRLFEEKVRWAVGQGIDTLAAGSAIARVGESFVGTPYRAGTLEAPGPEHLVINLHELDCVTFVETVLALTRFVRRDGVAALDDSLAARARYESYLREIRYRAGILDGYASRLHYFSDWLGSNAEAGHVVILTADLGGRPDSRPVTFMTDHAGAYPALSDSVTFLSIQATENRINTGPARFVIPKDSIAGIVNGIRDGDIIAAASTVAGLDVSHTGFALWRGGQLHLMHAPLTGSPVEISPLPLVERIQTITSQWGILVARVDDQWLAPAGGRASLPSQHEH